MGMQQISPILPALFDPPEIEIRGLIQLEGIANITRAIDNGTSAAIRQFESPWEVMFAESVISTNG